MKDVKPKLNEDLIQNNLFGHEEITYKVLAKQKTTHSREISIKKPKKSK